MNYAAIDKTTKVVINNIEWNGESYLDPDWKNNYDLISWDETTKGYPVSPGHTYDETSSGFIHPKPEQNPSFIFNKTTWLWEPPIPYPTDGARYEWNESAQQWDVIVPLPQQQLQNRNQELINAING
jgi:hypothetical protein